MPSQKLSAIVASLTVLSLSACNQDATSEPRISDVTTPAIAHSRDDVEKIVRAYILQNPEIILEAMNVLQEREALAAAEKLASDPRDMTAGSADAEVTIVNFFDYNCGYCKKSVDWVFDQVNEGKGNVRVIFKELPILSDQSRQAALAAIAAHKQGKYIEFHQKLMEQKAHALTDEKIDEIAKSLGLNLTRMHKDMESAETLSYIQDIRDQAIEFGATATPSFVINGELIQGFDTKALEARIQELLDAS